MTAVVETSMLQPPTLESDWAARITNWGRLADGQLWQCRLIGEHHGAEVVQYVQAHWVAGHWVWHYSCLYVTRRGPSCPAWCGEHRNQIASGPELESEFVYHAHGTPVGVDLTAIEDARTGQLAEVSITLPDAHHPVDAATARDLAAALVQAAELLEAGEQR